MNDLCPQVGVTMNGWKKQKKKKMLKDAAFVSLSSAVAFHIPPGRHSVAPTCPGCFFCFAFLGFLVFFFPVAVPHSPLGLVESSQRPSRSFLKQSWWQVLEGYSSVSQQDTSRPVPAPASLPLSSASSSSSP